jgi:DNA-binding FadR family transcriptional regulator
MPHPPRPPMPLQTIEHRRLYRQIADQLSELIEGGEFAAGHRLPPERDLARQLGVSRPSVREALIALEVEGRVEVRIGSGVYVTGRRPEAALQTLPPDSGPFDLLAARSLIEAECAALAAGRADRAQRRAIEEALAALRSAVRACVVSDCVMADREFHLRIAEASGNSALLMVLENLWQQRTGPLYMKLDAIMVDASMWPAIFDEHRQVFDAIRAGDARAARAAMRRHLAAAKKRFSHSLDRGGA